ncbi:hypothetical protein [Myxococcus sp. AB036A]|uniref:hypothetical protein n=1 Tax=Myxococcus sp. AB036A TaxID=2562793 RepID=UPI0011462384|nr:hypothetical protein [Myxococcus sp. AB036A]
MTEGNEQFISADARQLAEYKEPIGGGKRDRKACRDGLHDWECNTTGCADCWVPPCEPNRKKEQDAYDFQHQTTSCSPEERKRAYQEGIQQRLDRGEDPVGLQFERDVLNSLDANDVLFYSYSAHCKKCHVQAELDFVTRTHILECKNSPSGFKLDQMNDRILQIAAKCFPGKTVVCATRASNLEKLNNKMKQWRKQTNYDFGRLGV